MRSRSPRRHAIPQRRSFFIACEGQSEEGFVAWLQLLCNEQNLPVHLDRRVLGGGGPAALVRDAIKHRDRGGPFAATFLLLDTDRLDDGSLSSLKAVKRAGVARVILVRQRPNLEGVLLRLHRDHERDNPPASETEQRLKAAWPDYRKGMAAKDLARWFTLADLQRVAARDPDLNRLLTTIGLFARP